MGNCLFIRADISNEIDTPVRISLSTIHEDEVLVQNNNYNHMYLKKIDKKY